MQGDHKTWAAFSLAYLKPKGVWHPTLYLTEAQLEKFYLNGIVV